jgi:hypothetical protein
MSWKSSGSGGGWCRSTLKFEEGSLKPGWLLKDSSRDSGGREGGRGGREEGGREGGREGGEGGMEGRERIIDGRRKGVRGEHGEMVRDRERWGGKRSTITVECIKWTPTHFLSAHIEHLPLMASSVSAPRYESEASIGSTGNAAEQDEAPGTRHAG